jgi:tRNA dimethylallyltransferase
MPDQLYIICGPTASGKTALSIELAKALGTEIISFDSRQFFAEMQIGTAAPRAEEMAEVKHHFVRDRSVKDDYSAGQFELEAISTIEDLFKSRDTLVAVGGSGLYLDSITKGFADLPEVPPAVRENWNRLWKTEGLEYLRDKLSEKDPEYYAEVDLDNPHRLIRALELIEISGKKYSEIREHEPKKRPFNFSLWAIDWPREELYDRIDRRVVQMIEDGLVEEVRALVPFKEKRALATVGYQEIFAYLDGEISLDRAIELIQRNSRRYAKRQMTWLRREKGVHWLPVGSSEEMVNQILG